MNILASRFFKRHPFSDRIELNTRQARERDGWIEEARRSSSGESFWRDRAQQRCERDGHIWIRCQDNSANYCTCCGAMS